MLPSLLWSCLATERSLHGPGIAPSVPGTGSAAGATAIPAGTQRQRLGEVQPREKAGKHQPGELGGGRSCSLPGEGDRPQKESQGWRRNAVSPQGAIAGVAPRVRPVGRGPNAGGVPQHHRPSLRAMRAHGHQLGVCTSLGHAGLPVSPAPLPSQPPQYLISQSQARPHHRHPKSKVESWIRTSQGWRRELQPPTTQTFINQPGLTLSHSPASGGGGINSSARPWEAEPPPFLPPSLPGP